jgi:hypothetical protein
MPEQAALYVFSISIGNSTDLMEGRAAVASVTSGHTATTERGPPVPSLVIAAWHVIDFLKDRLI